MPPCRLSNHLLFAQRHLQGKMTRNIINFNRWILWCLNKVLQINVSKNVYELVNLRNHHRHICSCYDVILHLHSKGHVDASKYTLILFPSHLFAFLYEIKLVNLKHLAQYIDIKAEERMLAHDDVCLWATVELVIVYLSDFINDMAYTVVQIIVLKALVTHVVSLHIEHECVLSYSIFLAI